MDGHLGSVSTPVAGAGDPRKRAPRARRRLAALAIPIIGAGLGVVGAVAAAIPSASLCAAAGQGGHVALVVDLGNGSTTGRCVSFSGPTITGEQILKASGIEYATQNYGSMGDAVCQVESEPASYSKCLPSTGDYWALFVSRSDGAWQTAASGISSETFHSGDAEGLRYDPLTGNDPPPARSPVGICTTAAGGASSSGTAAAASTPSGPSVGLIAGLAVLAVLVVLIAVQLVVRRRRT